MKIEKYVPKPFFIETFSYEDFGRILGGFCDFFAGGTIFQGAKIISNF